MSTYRVELNNGSLVLVEADIVETTNIGFYFYLDPDGDKNPLLTGFHGTSELVAFVPISKFFSRVDSQEIA